MPFSPESTPRDAPPSATCQPCGAGCAHAQAIHPQWQGEWIWCEHPFRQHAARLIRVETECHRFATAPATPRT